jgi:DHA1 family multidrug resistance protein-like MFS transporter
MVNALIRDAPFGQLVRFLTKNRIFQYPEEDPNFKCPNSYAEDQPISRKFSRASGQPADEPATSTNADETEKLEPRDNSTLQPSETGTEEIVGDLMRDIEKTSSASTSASNSSGGLRLVSSNFTRTKSLPYTAERLWQDEQAAIERAEPRPIALTKTADGLTLVDWYSTDDPDNPQVRTLRNASDQRN